MKVAVAVPGKRSTFFVKYSPVRSGNVHQLQAFLPLCQSEEVKHRCLQLAIDFNQITVVTELLESIENINEVKGKLPKKNK